MTVLSRSTYLRALCSVACLTLASATPSVAQSASSWGSAIAPAKPAADAAKPTAPLAATAPKAGPMSLAEAEKAYDEAWEASPLMARKVMFVSEVFSMYGAATPRPTNVFNPGDKLITYVEPVGFGYKVSGEDVAFGMCVDFVIKSADGKIMGGQDNFSTISKMSHSKNRELMLSLTMSTDGLQPGNYVLEYKLRDTAGPKVATLSQPFVIAGPSKP